MAQWPPMRTGVIVVVVLLAAAAPAHAARTQLIARLHANARLYYGTSLASTRPTSIAARRPLTGVATTLPVLRRARSSDGTRWLRVLVPGRPNGHAAWIVDRRLKLTRTPWRIVVRTGTARVLVYRRNRLQQVFAAVVGARSTPTPRGRFFVEEAFALRRGVPGWPFAFALSARSDVFQEFEGGPGQIALHGTYGIGGTLGTAASHGCIRLDSRALVWLAHHTGVGTPVTIRR
jgi:lipoprotein-anchoring transpeptidase ErfK/SrfK